MTLTIEIHDAWFDRPEDLRKILTTLAGLECPPRGRHQAEAEDAEPFDPEFPPRGRTSNGRHPGDDDRSQAMGDDDPDDPEEDPPTDGRQLLGWAAKQTPDAKGRVIGFGKKKGFPPRVLDWTPQQVATAYRAARARRAGRDDPRRGRPRPGPPRPDAPGARGPGRAASRRPGQRRRRPVGLPRPAGPRPAASVPAQVRHLFRLAVPRVRCPHHAGPDDRGRPARHVAAGDDARADGMMTLRFGGAPPLWGGALLPWHGLWVTAAWALGYLNA